MESQWLSNENAEYLKLLTCYDTVTKQIPLDEQDGEHSSYDPREAKNKCQELHERKKKFFERDRICHQLIRLSESSQCNHVFNRTILHPNAHNFEIRNNPREIPFFSLQGWSYNQISRYFDPRLAQTSDTLGPTIYADQAFVEPFEEIKASNELIFNNFLQPYESIGHLDLDPICIEQSKEISSSSQTLDSAALAEELEFRDALLENLPERFQLRSGSGRKCASLLKQVFKVAPVAGDPENSYLEEASMKDTAEYTPVKLPNKNKYKLARLSTDPDDSFITELSRSGPSTPSSTKPTSAPSSPNPSPFSNLKTKLYSTPMQITSSTPKPTPIQSDADDPFTKLCSTPIRSRVASSSVASPETSLQTSPSPPVVIKKTACTRKPIQDNVISSSEGRENVAVAQQDAIPVIKKQDTTTVVGQQDAIPVIKKQDTTTVVGQQDTIPVIKKQDTTTVVEQQDTIPVIKKQDTITVVEQQDVIHVIEPQDTTTVIAQETPEILNSRRLYFREVLKGDDLLFFDLLKGTTLMNHERKRRRAVMAGSRPSSCGPSLTKRIHLMKTDAIHGTHNLKQYLKKCKKAKANEGKQSVGNTLLDASLSSIRSLKGDCTPTNKKRVRPSDTYSAPPPSKSPKLITEAILDQKFEKLPLKDREIAKLLSLFCKCWIEEVKHNSCVDVYSDFLFLINNRYTDHIEMITINQALGVLSRSSEIGAERVIMRTALFTLELYKLLSSQK